ncbi:hypothetical protein B5S28_g191 [[Candida] boidinii]|nr:hypothetical protein B5S28_g191 [[Candida] boidinii]OWB64051.1 hypothetical protein B5S29_g5083 [[Candida] boidinii]
MGLIDSVGLLLDKPGFDWKLLIVGFSTANFIFDSYLKYRQIKEVNRNGNKIPTILQGNIDEKTVLKSSNYGIDKLKFSLFTSFYSLVQNLAFIKFDILPKLWTSSANFLVNYGSKFLPAFMNGAITQSLLFVGQISLISLVLGLPITYYSNFVIEEKYGFNKLTIKLWITDMVKSLFVGCLLGGPILAGFLKIIEYFGDSFTYYLSIFLFVVQIFLIIVYPKFIQPLFNKLTPLEDGELKTTIEKLAHGQNFPLDKLYVIDGSKRSSHSNAYFMGLPWGSKQIVLFDTLVEKSTTPETTAVLGHEIGHWALSHTTKLLVISQVHIFFIFSLFAGFIKNNSLFESFGFPVERPILIGFMLFGDILKPVDAIMEFVMNLLSREYEYQADRYAAELGYSDELKQALINLHKENLSTVTVDWLYSAYSYNHPHVTERLEYIDEVAKEVESKKLD